MTEQKEIKEHVVNELYGLIDMLPKDLKDDDLVPEDVKQKMKERTDKLMQYVSDA